MPSIDLENPPAAMKAEILLTVEYDLNDVMPDELDSNLHYAIQNAIGNGLLTGPFNKVEVEHWSLVIQVKSQEE